MRKSSLIAVAGLLLVLVQPLFWPPRLASAQNPATALAAAPEAKPELVVQLGNPQGVGLVAYSPDGKLALAADDERSSGKDFSICLWDIETGKQLRRFVGHTDALTAIVFSRDSRFAASSSRDKTARIWDVRTGTERQRFLHPNWVQAVAFSPDGTNLLTGTGVSLFNESSLAYIWDLTSAQPAAAPIRRLEGHPNNINAVAYAPDGKTIVTGCADSKARLWNAADGKLIATLTGHKFPVVAVAFSHDGKSVVTGSGDKTARIWDVANGHETKQIACPSYVESVAFSPDDRQLLTGCYRFDEQIHLWDIATGNDLRAFKAAGQAAFSADGRLVLLAGKNELGSTASLWETASGKLVRRFESISTNVLDVAVSPDANYLATVSSGGLCRLWDLNTGRMIRRVVDGFELNNGQEYSIQSVNFSPDGKYLVTAEDNDVLAQKGGGVQFWELGSGAKAQRVATGPSPFAAVSADGQFIVTGIGSALTNTDSNAYLYRVESGKQERKFTGQTGSVQFVALSRDGRLLLTRPSNLFAQTDDPPRLWEVKSSRELHKFAPPPDQAEARASAAALSPDGRFAATANRDYKSGDDIFVWDAASGQLLKTLRGHAEEIDSLAFSSDGRSLLSGSRDTTVRLWDVDSGAETRTFTGHGDGVNAVRFTPDGRFVVSASDDSTVRIWAAQSGQELCRLISLNNDDWVAVTPDGRFDTNNLEDLQGLHWIMPDDPLKPVPLEIFMRQYYEPKLLARVLAGEEFKPVPSIASLNRIQPAVTIAKIEPDKNIAGQVSVTVAVANRSGSATRDGIPLKLDSGVFDLRLFRDGELVGYDPEKDGQVKLEANGTATVTFPHIKLPHNSTAKQVSFTAYAFNSDRVKSSTDRKDLDLPRDLESHPGRAFIITVGVNAYENATFDLQFAANDARRMQQVLTERLTATGQFAEVVPVSLISDYDAAGGRNIPVLTQATKENVRKVFQLLSNRRGEVDRKSLDGIANLDKLTEATPDDLVMIVFSSHGYADRDGAFYLIPYDTGEGSAKVFTPTVREHSISSDELSLWLRDVDAGEMVMIVDACHSTAAIEGLDFKPGPMGSRGLGQLAYDKGMRILTATQSDNVALENGALKQGLLTYALVRDGIEAGQADFKPKDQVITLAEWLQYGAQRVPTLYDEVKQGKIQTFGLVNSASKPVVTSGNKQLEEVVATAAGQARTQQPALFDFTRGRPALVLSR